MIPLATLLSAGSCLKPEPVIERALFCDIEEKRRFSQAEIDWRSANAPTNLRRDFKTNLAYERECEVET